MLAWKKIITSAGELALLRIVEDENSFFVPINEKNRHYQEYLEWVAEGNTAEVIEEP